MILEGWEGEEVFAELLLEEMEQLEGLDPDLIGNGSGEPLGRWEDTEDLSELFESPHLILVGRQKILTRSIRGALEGA